MKTNNIFTEKFLNLDSKLISDEISENGFFSFENALTNDFVDKILEDVKDCGLALNKNNIAGVYYKNVKQFFLTHMLAVSKKFFDYCTNLKIFDICDNYIGNQYRLKAIRYYENYGGQKMQWHSDNRVYEMDTVETSSGINTQTKGLIFLAYVTDVNDGEFQYIKGSHHWSKESDFNDYTVEYVNKNFASDIIGFKKKKGSIIIYNSHGVHRAKPSEDKKLIRKSLFMQVDKEINTSEPMLIKTEFVEKLDDKIKMYLGFGKKTGLELFPDTNLGTMPMNKKTLSKILAWLFWPMAKKLPGFFRKKILKIIKY